MSASDGVTVCGAAGELEIPTFGAPLPGPGTAVS